VGSYPAHVEDRIARALAFDRGVRRRGARRVIELAEGVVVRDDELPALHHLNALLLDAPLAEALRDPSSLARFADQHLDGLGYRHVVLDDIGAADMLAPALLESGWTPQRIVFMHRARARDRAPRAGLTRRLDDDEARALQLAITAEEAPRDDGVGGAVAAALVRQLVAGQEAMRGGTTSIVFGAGEHGVLASSCTLFVCGPGQIAMIEEVGTLTAHRERGLARAVLGAAVDEAQRLGCEEIIVPTEEDDWPQLLYLKLGFEPLARQVWFTLRDVGR
jgi:GNAT superfamily N-acetyltransferase